MKKTTMRLFALAMLMIFSIGAAAKIDVQITNDGKFDGGTIEVTYQKDLADGVEVTITVTPNDGYTITKGAITVVSTYPPSGNSNTRTPEIAESLTLYYNGSAEKDIDDATVKRDYTFIVPSGFGAWVKEAEFQAKSSPSKNRGGITITENLSNPVYYLIQSLVNTAFYMRPTTGNVGNVTTLNILTDEMKWFFLNAGTEDDTQYYYICRKDGNDIKYMYFSSPNFVSTSQRIWITLTTTPEEGSEDNYKFSIAKKNTKGWDAYNIIPKGTTNSSCLNKQGGNAGSGNIQVGSGFDDAGSCWNFISLSDYEWSLGPKCFTVTVSDANKYCYRIQSQQDKSYSIKPGDTYVNTSNIIDDDTYFYFKEAESDQFMTYYYIIHVNTGQYLRYKSTGVNQGNAVELKDHEGSEAGNEESRFQFAVVRGSNSNESLTDTKGIIFNIVPKLLVSNNTSSLIRSVSCDKGQGNALNTRNSRNSPDTHWSFESVTYTTICANPTITFSNVTGKATISTTTARSDIYYTTDESTPSSSNGTQYTGPFDVTEQTTIRAIVTRTSFTDSEVTTKTIYQVVAPTIQNNGSNAIIISTTTEGATIYYTLDGSIPNTSSTKYTGPITDVPSGVTVKAIAVKEGMVNSVVSTGTFTLQCDKPVIARTGNTVTITCSYPTSGVSIYYTKNGGEPSSGSTLYTIPIEVVVGDVIKAIAIADDYENSEIATKNITEELTPTDGKYLINNQSDFNSFVDMASNTEGAAYHYVLKSDVSAGAAIPEPFTGIFEVDADANGNYYKISGLTHALFNTISGGSVKNVMLDNVRISGGTNVGAIANEVTGTSTNVASIYNCGVLSGRVSGSGYVGGLVGLLGNTTDNDQCYARVINCFSYADIEGGSDKGGIVGYNSFSSTASDIRTMVMNCMFYGNISEGNAISPVFGGLIIENLLDGVNTYNYYRYQSNYSYYNKITKYNNSFAAKEEYLNRFEFYRLMLNSNKKLAALYATGSVDDAEVKMAKWVLETADRSISGRDPYPYPVLKAQGEYPSIINYDVENAPDSATVGRNHGGVLDAEHRTLTVNISGTKTNGGQDWPDGAGITTTSKTIKRTDKDFDRYNYNYDKIQLPYYNDVGTGNYTGNRVVTGWKITAVTGGTSGTFTQADAFGGYNFADRKCTQKDIYSVSGRVFSQGAYYDVPYGVTGITIEPYWGNAAYLADPKYDVVYKNDYTGKQDVIGTQVDNSTTFNGQSVKSTISDALGAITSPGASVYDNAIVLVGNVHLDNVPSADGTHYTIMSVDENNDLEPDYSLIYHHSGRTAVSPIRFDFLNMMGTAQAQKPHNATKFLNVSIFNPKGWFEMTNTSLAYFSQIEYDNGGNKLAEPLILQGGVFDQIISSHDTPSKTTTYIHVGSNVKFKQFNNGCHSDISVFTKHIPISVTGGDYDAFYLSGIYKPDAAVSADDAEGYISGGRFNEVAGAGQQMIDGKVQWQIYDADIENFYGGGINAAKPITGNVTVNLYNCHIGTYCGGPKFGNMYNGKIVTTVAEGCTFDAFYGAGYGGTSYNTIRTRDKSANDVNFPSWESDYTTPRGDYSSANKGIATDFDYEFFVWSTGETGGRFYVKYASLSTAQTNDVNSTLTNCTVNGNLYGGGKLGRVDGKATTILDGCTVTGSVYGAGYSASLDPVKVRDGGFGGTPVKYPNVNTDSGMFEDGEFSGTTEYIWKKHALTDGDPNITSEGGNFIYTDVDLDILGEVENAELTIKGNTVVNGSVYGGGEEAVVNKNAKVTLTAGTIGTRNEDGTYLGGANYGNVYGGGRGKADDKTAGLVKGKTDVIIENGNIYHNIYGGGAYGSVGSFNYHATTGMPTGLKDDAPEESGKCNVTVKGGTIGYNGKENGMVFGSSRGDVSTPVAGVDFNDYLAWVNETHVTIGTQGSDSGPLIKGSVYGGGENGHTYTDAEVIIHSGTIGVPDGDPLPVDVDNTPDDPTDDISMSGAHYPYRGNVYGGGCGTDEYTLNDKKYYNLIAGIVMGNTTVSMDGGHVVHNVYGAGAMGSVGTYTLDTNNDNNIPNGKPISCANGTGQCTVTISGGMVGYKGASMLTSGGPDDFGHVFGAGRGEVKDSTLYVNLPIVGYVNKTNLTIRGTAFVTGSVYGGGENGHVLGDTYVTVSGGQIGCGEDKDAPYTDEDFENAIDETGNVTEPLNECAHWDYSGDYSPYDRYSGAPGYDSQAAAGGLKVATDGHTFYGNVFGGGSGYYPYAPGKWLRSAGLVEGDTHVTISDGHILSNVYGGNEHTDVYGDCYVTMTGGTVGVPVSYTEKRKHPRSGNLFGAGKGDKRILFNTWTNVKSTTVTVSGGRVYGAVFGGGEDGHVLTDATTTISQQPGKTTIIGTIGTTGYDGYVFGGGRGSSTALTAGVVCGNTTLNIEGGTILGSAYGGGRLSSVGTHLVPPNSIGSSQPDHTYYGKEIADGYKQVDWEKYWDEDPSDDADVRADGRTHGHITVNISGGTIGAVDSDGKLLNSQFSIGDVFGGCKGTTNGEYSASVYSVEDAHAKLGIAKSAIVNLLGGTVHNSIYGGGELGNVGDLGVTEVTGEGNQRTIKYEDSSLAYAKINLLGGSVGNVFGGGLGMKKNVNGTEDAAALVKGNVTVNLNGLETDDYVSAIHSTYVGALLTLDNSSFYRVADGANSGCQVNGTIFGCNNINGTPLGHAQVHVFKTTKRTGQAESGEGDDVANAYDVAAVYGGGNRADYVPATTDEQQKTEVIIEGCGLTSIYQVYGGGNAAATPGTLVTVKGTKKIYEVFGGGNGVSTTSFTNPGANVGYRTEKDESGQDVGYGGDNSGSALVQLMAGRLIYAYGGSNTKGDIRSGSNVVTVDNQYVEGDVCCEHLEVDHMFGGGKNAGMKSGANIILGCSNSNSWVKEIYAGAENADVLGDVSLTITSGKFGRVFGGNKESGKLEGSITVNIEENGQCGIPVIIGELYGGGNKAPYSIYGYNDDGTPKTSGSDPKPSPVVNVRSFTSIGNIYGGGYGAAAVMYGSPTVNINEIPNHKAGVTEFQGNEFAGQTLYFVNDVLDPARTAETTLESDYLVILPSHEDKKMGAIQNVFGGGNAAAVYGNTLVNIAVTSEEPLQQLDAQGNPKYTDEDKTTPAKDQVTVVGADIRGNVYGGGNEAIVSGNTDVVIGREDTPTSTSPARASEPPSESQPVIP